MTKENEKQNIGLAILTEKVTKVEAWVDNADENHFPTIAENFVSVEKRFDKLDKQLAWYSGSIATLVFVIEFILRILKP